MPTHRTQESQRAALLLKVLAGPRCPSFCDPEIGSWLWRTLRGAFPGTYAVCFVHHEIHLVTNLVGFDEAIDVRPRICRLVGQFTRKFDLHVGAATAMNPQEVPTLDDLCHWVREVHLLPCRAGLALCPLAWPFSTHRDLVGAVVDPWVSAARLAAALEIDDADFSVGFHEHVSDDLSAVHGGTPYPRAMTASLFPSRSFNSVVNAAAGATRSIATGIRSSGPTRIAFVLLALWHGWRNLDQLALLCRCSRRTILRISKLDRPELLGPARLCLGDERLQVVQVAGSGMSPDAGTANEAIRRARIISGLAPSAWQQGDPDDLS